MRSPLPREHTVTSAYGMRTLTGQAPAMHNGIDLKPKNGRQPCDILAVCAGTVIAVETGVPDSHTGLGVTSKTAGNYVYYQTEQGHIVKYHHLKAGTVCVKNGDRLVAGDRVGEMGTTGKSTGVHLHYEIRMPNGSAFDPAPYLDNDKLFPAATAAKPVLRRGSTGNAVRDLQQMLNKAGAKLVTDGIYGPLTEAAVRTFQTNAGIKVDGICGPETWGKMEEGT